jgi:acyl-CoA synthetase (AMP-forming)/AMP-acid ligase II
VELLVGDIFRQAAVAVPHRMAAAMGDRSITFAELLTEAEAVAARLHALGVGPGDRVVVWSATSLDVVPVYAGCALAGAVFCPMSPLLSPGEAAPVLRAVAPALVLTDTERSHALVQIDRPELPPGMSMAALDPIGLSTSAGPRVDAADAAFGTLAGCVDGPLPPAPLPGLRETDPHVVFLTSGSTGTPKGVVISHRASVLRSHPGSQLEPRGVAVCMFPMFHMAPWTISLQQWHARDGVAYVATATADEICSAVVRHRAERLNAIPAVWQRLLDHLASEGAAGDELSTIRFADTGTSATPPALMAALMAALPAADVRIFYGSTEAGNVAALDHVDIARKPGRIGVPSVGTDLRLDDAGELWARNAVLFDGYLGLPAETAAALVDGWYRTGDLAEVDDEGFWSIIGRARDVIRTGGETVAPGEVEAALATHPQLADVAVVGVPDERWGETVCAVVVAGPGGEVPGLDQLRDWCEGRLAVFKRPRRVIVVDEIPRTAATRQVQRKVLVERIQSGELS